MSNDWMFLTNSTAVCGPLYFFGCTVPSTPLLNAYTAGIVTLLAASLAVSPKFSLVQMSSSTLSTSTCTGACSVSNRLALKGRQLIRTDQAQLRAGVLWERREHDTVSLLEISDKWIAEDR